MVYYQKKSNPFAGFWDIIRILFILSILCLFTLSCDIEKIEKIPATKYVIIIVMDGARYSETWGDPTSQYIPLMSGEMKNQGIYYTHFYNNGPTSTTSGHTSITTGAYQIINNSGGEWPAIPSIFHFFNLKYAQPVTNSWIIASKSKLEVLSKCLNPLWMNNFRPSTDCGVDGLGSNNRADSLTYNTTLNILTEYHPNLVLINFMESDIAGHSGNWESYVKAISKTDEYIHGIWKFIQTDTCYKNRTTLFVTNDHGRHLDGINGGFASHGDTCEGCRHISLYAFGPNIKQGAIIETERELIDIPVTVANLLNFKLGSCNGHIMNEMFVKSVK